jgi:CDP-4-dehydro-6-deoxyglucose reductase
MSSFAVRVEPLGRSITVRDDQSVLDAALGAGLNLLHSCKAGHCGSCRAWLRSGSIAYPMAAERAWPNGVPPGLTAEEARAGRVLLCQARPLGDLVVEQEPMSRTVPIEIRRLPCRIERRVLLAPDVMQLFLRVPAAEPLDFLSGQYLDVLLDGERRRSFSIASPPHDARPLELHVRRAPQGGFTSRLFDELADGALLRIEGPIGQFVYVPGTAPLLFIAGGTGFAPLKSMLRHALEIEATQRPIHFYWGGRAPADIYEADWMRDVERRHPNVSFTPVLSEGEHAHWVHEVAARDRADLAQHEVYVAGPPALVEAVRASYPPLGVPAGHIRFDSFDYAPR